MSGTLSSFELVSPDYGNGAFDLLISLGGGSSGSPRSGVKCVLLVALNTNGMRSAVPSNTSFSFWLRTMLLTSIVGRSFLVVGIVLT